jgi:hypothetical protein
MTINSTKPGALSGWTGASSADLQTRPDRPIRRSEIKYEGWVFPPTSVSVVLYVIRGVLASPGGRIYGTARQ